MPALLKEVYLQHWLMMASALTKKAPLNTLRTGLWWPPLTIICWISTQWLWKVGVDSLHNPEKIFLQCIHVSTYIFWANTTLSFKWLNNLTNSLISTHTTSLTFYPSYETNLQKCEDRCCPNFSELSLLFCSTCTNLHKMHSTCLLSVQNPYMYFQTCLLFSPYAHLQLQVGWNLNLILEIYSLGEGDFFDFLLELITASLATIMEKNVFGLQNKFWKSCLK